MKKICAKTGRNRWSSNYAGTFPGSLILPADQEEPKRKVGVGTAGVVAGVS